jgi:hypothetical protein
VENALITVIIVAVLTFGTAMLGKATLGSVDDLGRSWKAMEVVAGERARTQVTVIDAATDGTGTNVFEPGILNPGEEMTIQAKVSPTVGAGTTNWATVATPNGISLTAYFVH